MVGPTIALIYALVTALLVELLIHQPEFLPEVEKQEAEIPLPIGLIHGFLMLAGTVMFTLWPITFAVILVRLALGKSSG